ncbi:MAG: RluA family pseudouridine synthase [Peptococcaceae bacterium]|nr:RluA family pseudouridine synthase [Peptococcaceae bacterium]
MPTDTIFRHILDDKDHEKKLEDILRGRFRFSRKLIQRLKTGNKTQLDGVPVYLTTRGFCGQTMVVDLFEPEEAGIEPEDLPLDILYEDAFYLAVNKPPGQIVHPVGPHIRGTLANAVAGYWQKQGERRLFRPVFRTDRDTSGIILIAKNRYAQQQISNLSDKQQVKKIYLGIVQGEWPQANPTGILDIPMGPKPGSKILQQIHLQGKPAQTEYHVLATDGRYTLIQFRLITGRTHQIRVHCQAVGYPLAGDTLYGGTAEVFRRQALHAYRYGFIHPFTQNPLSLKAPIPDDLLRTGLFPSNIEDWDMEPRFRSPGI